MRHSRRSQIAIVLIGTSAVIGVTAWVLDRADPGMTFGGGLDAQGRQTLVVETVQPGGLAWCQGARAGDIVINIGGIPTLPGDEAVQEAYENATPSSSSLITVSPA